MNTSEVNRWLTYAKSDLDAAQALLLTPEHYPRQACFFAQQATEKVLKAALISQEIEFPYTHDLDRLRNLLPDNWRVKTMFPDLADLTIWAIETRYPGDMPDVFEVDAKQALQKAKTVYQVVFDDLQQQTNKEK